MVTVAAKSGLLIFLSTPSARRATCSKLGVTGVTEPISIHALREEGDSSG